MRAQAIFLRHGSPPISYGLSLAFFGLWAGEPAPYMCVYASVIMSNSRNIVSFLVFEVPIFTNVLKRKDSDKTPKEQLPKMLRFDLTRLSQICVFLSISWNFVTLKFCCV